MFNIKNKFKSLTSLSLIFCFVLSAYVFASEPIPATAVISDTYTLAEGVVYTGETLVDEKSNVHRAFVVEYSPESAYSSIEFLFGNNLNTRNTVTQLLKDAEKDGDIEGTAVAAMNADFFNMSTGLAESAVIKDGYLLTSDRNNYAFAFDSHGVPFIDKPAVSMSLKTPYKEYSVLHYNKEFTEYGLYLYSSAFGADTKIAEPSVELVLAPYSESLGYDGMYALMYSQSDIPFDLELKSLDEQGNEVITINERYKSDIEEFAEENGYVHIGFTFYKPCDAKVKLGDTISAYVEEIRFNDDGKKLEIPEDRFVLCANKETQSFKFENVKEYDSLHITFNCNEKFLDVDEAIGCGALIVENGEIVENTDLSHYLSPNPRTAIGISADNKVIMFAVDGRQGTYSKGFTLKELSAQMKSLGCVVAANLDGGGSTVVKAVLPGDGIMQTVNSPSDKSERKVSNAIAFYNLVEADGSKAYSYLNSPNRLVLSNSSLELGQAFYTDHAHYPSGFSKVRNNEREKNLLEREQMVTDDEILNELLDISSSNDFAYSVESEKVEYEYEGFEYSVDEGKGTVENGVYKPNGYVGDVYIISESPLGLKNEAVRFTSLGNVDSIEVEGAGETMYIGDTYDLSAKAFYKGFEVVGGDDCFKWKTNQSSLSVDETGLVTANHVSNNACVTVSFGKTKKELKINVLDLPFVDISSNWAKSNIIKLYDKGISNGELTELGRMYFPQRNFTRSEFCVMLARLLGYSVAVDFKGEEDGVNVLAEENAVDVKSGEDTYTDADSDLNSDESGEVFLSEETEEAVEEIIAIDEVTVPDYYDFESIPSWARDSVVQLYNKGLLEGFEHCDENGNFFDGSNFVTRREVIRLVGLLTKKAPDDYIPKLSDVKIDDSDYECIRNVLYNGIFTGYLDGTLRCDTLLTRAEVSAVFIRLLDTLNDNIG